MCGEVDTHAGPGPPTPTNKNVKYSSMKVTHKVAGITNTGNDFSSCSISLVVERQTNNLKVLGSSPKSSNCIILILLFFFSFIKTLKR